VRNLKERVIRGGAAKLCGQTANLMLRLGFVATMARLLSPEDFGLFAMVIAVTGIYDLFTTGGLSLATVQRPTITEEQISNLFWVNLLIGIILCFMCFVSAPFLVALYSEPRLFWITVALGGGFLFNAAGVQHSALLQRQLRYVGLTTIELASLLVSYVLGIGLALWGFGYWALVGSTITTPAVSSALMWIFTGWMPSLPRRFVDVRSMLRFGGIVTLNNLIVHIAYNLDKLLIGRVWGPGALGLYGTAYQLVNVPTRALIEVVGVVGFSALSRLQEDPHRVKIYFLKGCSLLVSLTAPITIFAAFFADDIVLVVLGSQWMEAAPIFRLLAPTILVFSIINPTGLLLQTSGLHVRSLIVALALAPLTIAGYLVGLPYGPMGVAAGFSTAMLLWVVPHVIWCLHNTGISPREFLGATWRPFFASIVATGLAFGISQLWLAQFQSPFVRLLFLASIMVGSYLCILVFAMGQKALYLGLLKDLGVLRSRFAVL
jgi:O-antigen/teichoic acid export membrane protein